MQTQLFTDTELSFNAYDKAHPDIYREFRKCVLDSIKMGEKYITAKGIFEDIRRWHRITRTGNFKVDNNFSAYYARKFIKEFPQYAEMVKFRKSKFDNITI